MTWIAVCDGEVTECEYELLRAVAAASLGGPDLLAVVDVARHARLEDLDLACRYLSTHTDRGTARLLLELAISMAVQDREMSVGQNHVLQFLADLLGVRPRTFARLFRHVTHQPFPLAGDPGSPLWWQRREAGEPAQEAPDDWEADGATPARRPARAAAGAPGGRATAEPDEDDDAPMSRPQALRLLGLGRNPSTDEVHNAYRKLAKTRHPDRFVKLGPVAMAAATDAFERLRQAYEVASIPAPFPRKPRLPASGGGPSHSTGWPVKDLYKRLGAEKAADESALRQAIGGAAAHESRDRRGGRVCPARPASPRRL